MVKRLSFICCITILYCTQLNSMELPAADTNSRVSTQWFTLSYPVSELVIENDTEKSVLVTDASKQYFFYHTINSSRSWYFKKPYNKRIKNQTELSLTINHEKPYDGIYTISYDSPRSACKESLKALPVSKIVTALQSNNIELLARNKRKYVIGDVTIMYDPKNKEEDLFKKSTDLIKKRSQSF